MTMSENSRPLSLPPFVPSYRAAGLLLHVTSLPSPSGIGDVGPAALSWIDRLDQAGQRWWQALPLGPTGYGNSPYQSLSSFAGNELLISPDWLLEDELLRASDCQVRSFPQNDINYNTVIPFKHGLLKTAWANFNAGARADLRLAYQQFRNDQAHWLEDYALFRARRELADQMGWVSFAQFLLFRQGERLKAHAHSKGLGLIGDLPFFVSPDSSDVWANPELFLLNEQRRPRFVAGVPPDYFSAQGQLWGNPVYNWDALRSTGYRWCIDRLRALLAHVDVIRLDHFRGFAAAWHVPAGASTAQSGQWVQGPGANFFEAVRKELGGLPFIAEDLGMITPDVYALRDQLQLPGTRVLQFAFDGHSDNPYLPHNFIPNTVAYTGTHDNAPTRQWYEELPDYQRQNFWSYANRAPGGEADAAPALMQIAWSSSAALAIVPMQDLLNLGAESRMNVPGRASGNWGWRCPEDKLSSPAFEWLREQTESTNRKNPEIASQLMNLESSSAARAVPSQG